MVLNSLLGRPYIFLTLSKKISGLKINNNKTQISWIGSKKNCNIEYMKDKNFVWDPGTFKVLGVVFSTNTQDICSLNYSGRIEEVKRDIARWKKRRITPLGKITIIKTLILSKLTYLFLNIPDPSKEFLEEIEQLLFRFIWNGKTNKIKKTIVCKSYEDGGLKMVDIHSFLSSLKISWLRRLAENNSSFWATLYPFVHNLQKFGSDYIHHCSTETKNPFWIDVLKHYKRLLQVNRGQDLERCDLHHEPIYYNVNIKRDNKTLYIEEWEANGILKVRDVLDNYGNLIDFNTFKNRYNTPQTNFLLYFGVANAIKTYLNNVKHTNKYKKILVNEAWSCIQAGNKAVKSMFQNNKVTPTSIAKWKSQFEINDWKTIFTDCFKTTPDPQLQWFQARLLHRIIPTNKYLALCKITDSSLCTFCSNAVESINHLFWNCEFVQSFWNDLVTLLHEKCIHCERLSFNEQLILFGSSDKMHTDKPICFIILFAKFFIYKCKLNNDKPHIKQFIPQLGQRLSIEHSLAYRNDKEKDFTQNWQIYKPLFKPCYIPR